MADMVATLKRAAAALRDAGVPYAVGGGFAAAARGEPKASDTDIDLMIRKDDAGRAVDALEAAGMRPERPPEGWLVKAWDGDVVVDLIYEPAGFAVDDAVLARAEERSVHGMPMPVLDATDLLVALVWAQTEEDLDFTGLVRTTRALREQVDWDVRRSRTEGAPFARAFLVLVEDLGLVDPG